MPTTVAGPGHSNDQIHQRPAQSLRIVLVEFLPSGGMYQFAFQFGQALAEAGHHVQLLTGPDPELMSTTDGFEVIEAFPTWHPNIDIPESSVRRKLRRVERAIRLLESWRRTLVHLRKNRPDVAQFGELRYPVDTAALVILARWGRADAVVDVAHNPLPYDVNSKTEAIEKNGRFTYRLLKRAYQACDLVFVLGEGPKAMLEREFPEVSRVAICGHGDYSSVLAAVETPPPSSAPPHALFFGSWTKYKNIPLMLDAFAAVRKQLPQARLTVAGPVMPDIDLPAITARAAKIGNVDLLPGYVPMERIPELFATHRVVLFTYETVNISGSVHMAYTFGRPVVATNVGSMSDAVEHSVTGLLTPSDAGSIAHAVLEILGDPAAADRMGEAGARAAHSDSSWAAVAKNAAAHYPSALSRSRS